jgi:hypothetical protein
MTLESDFVTVMQADNELMALLAGGVHQALAVGQISRQNTPAAYDENSELQPCALVKLETEIPTGPYPNSVQTPVSIYFYQREHGDVIDEAMALVFPMFNRVKLGSGVWRVEYENSVWNQYDAALECALNMMRFNVIRLKPATPEGGYS